MFQEPETSLKQDIVFVLAVAAAGFKLTDNRSVNTSDGVCWEATLVHGRTKIVTVSNAGTGGDSEADFHATTDVGKAADKVYLERLFAVPQVIEAVRGHLMQNLKLKQQFNRVSDADYEATKAGIYASTPVPTVDNIEFLVGHLADITGMVKKIKRDAKARLLVVFEGDDAKGEYSTYKLADTPANREGVKARATRKIDYFIADLLGATNEPDGA